MGEWGCEGAEGEGEDEGGEGVEEGAGEHEEDGVEGEVGVPGRGERGR